jgi:hypothetical protein
VYRNLMKAASTSPSTPCRVMCFSRASRMSASSKEVKGSRLPELQHMQELTRHQPPLLWGTVQ